jgi:hypothetical protein
MQLYLSEQMIQSGASIKHTFIQFGGAHDVPRRRTQSLPPQARAFGRDASTAEMSEIPDDDGLTSDGGNDVECELTNHGSYLVKAAKRPTSAGTQCSESTASGTSGQNQGPIVQRPRSRPSSAGTWSSSASQAPEIINAPESQLATDSQLAMEAMTVELSEQVAAVISREFAYLRLCCHRLQLGKPRPKSGQTPITLYFYMYGLPSAKRSKWRQPLLWAFAALLAKNGIPTSMMSGQLRAWPDQTYRLQIDIAAAREGRDF